MFLQGPTPARPSICVTVRFAFGAFKHSTPRTLSLNEGDSTRTRNGTGVSFNVSLQQSLEFMWSRRHSGSRSLPSNSNRQHRLSGTSDMSRVQDRFQAVPVGTLALVCVNVAVHGLVFVTSFNAGLISISAYQVIYQREVRPCPFVLS